MGHRLVGQTVVEIGGIGDLDARVNVPASESSPQCQVYSTGLATMVTC